MKVYLHDDKPAGAGEKHGIRGPTHCGTTEADYEYQVELVVDDWQDCSAIVRIECPDLGREWKRDESGRLVEVTLSETAIDLTAALKCAGCGRLFSEWQPGPLGTGGQPEPYFSRCRDCQPREKP